MKDKTQMASYRGETKPMNWLYHEELEDDFLLGKTPKSFSDTWEDEE